MPNRDDFPATYHDLKAILEPYAAKLIVDNEAEGNYSLSAPPSRAYPKSLWFGGVQIKKNYVSFHLMPIYVFPDLVEGISERLLKRKQGKSCFNFTKSDAGLFEELSRLAEAGFERYRREQYV